MRLRSLLRPLRNPGSNSLGPWLLLAFALFYLFLIRYCKTHFYRDPTSFFFQPDLGYQRHYSLIREQQANDFIEKASQVEGSKKTPARKHAPKMCIGIATVGRPNSEQYVQATIGSLLEGLDVTEREEIHLAVLIAHTKPSSHPTYGESWLLNLVDKIYLYDVSPEQSRELKQWEKERDFRKKAIFDYTYILSKCADTGAHWVAMIEDDTIAVRGWYGRAMAALEQADDKHKVGAADGTGDWLYLRMFFTEEFLGWNAEEWPTYLFMSALVVGSVALTLFLLRRLLPVPSPPRYSNTDDLNLDPYPIAQLNHSSSPTTTTTTSSSVQLANIIHNTFLTPIAMFTITLIMLPSLILLFFLAGRESLAPQLHVGVSEMPRFGCCAQGLIFSAETTPRIIEHLREAKIGFVDQLIEEWANTASRGSLGSDDDDDDKKGGDMSNGKKELVRWVVVPSLLQHVGAHSSKGDDRGEKAKWDRSVAEKIWNFGFEMYDSSHL